MLHRQIAVQPLELGLPKIGRDQLAVQ